MKNVTGLVRDGTIRPTLDGRIDSNNAAEAEDDVRELCVEAKTENLPKVLAFVEEALEEVNCPMAVAMQIDIAVEEIYVNIANYAYKPGTGDAKILVKTDREKAVITFFDHGIPYNPLAKEDPDVTLSAEERSIGGLGIFMVKKSMDDLNYEYRDGQNIFTLKKVW